MLIVINYRKKFKFHLYNINIDLSADMEIVLPQSTESNIAANSTNSTNSIDNEISEQISEYITNYVKQIIDNVIANMESIESSTSLDIPAQNICELDESTNVLIYTCPHCSFQIMTYVSELACHIFRHGMIKSTQTQVSPHASKQECDNLASNPDIIGCCKPYRITEKLSSSDNNNQPQKIKYYVEVCDYI